MRNENVQHLAVLVDGTRWVLEPRIDPEKDLIEIPPVAWARAARAQPPQ